MGSNIGGPKERFEFRGLKGFFPRTEQTYCFRQGICFGGFSFQKNNKNYFFKKMEFRRTYAIKRSPALYAFCVNILANLPIYQKQLLHLNKYLFRGLSLGRLTEGNKALLIAVVRVR
jgi:hypothetical protein